MKQLVLQNNCFFIDSEGKSAVLYESHDQNIFLCWVL